MRDLETGIVMRSRVNGAESFSPPFYVVFFSKPIDYFWETNFFLFKSKLTNLQFCKGIVSY